MITEDFCSYEVAKLLEEKGFNEPTWTRYEDNDEVIFGDKYNWNNSPMGQISAPTHQMAMKWLREVHKILIVISPHDGKGYSAILYDIIDFVSYDDFRYIKETDYFFNPEEAVEAACIYSLKNLI